MRGAPAVEVRTAWTRVQLGVRTGTQIAYQKKKKVSEVEERREERKRKERRKRGNGGENIP